MSIDQALAGPPRIAAGLARLPCPLAERLVLQVQRLLVEKGFLRAPHPLADLHRVLPPDDLVLDENYLNAVTRAFYVQDADLHGAYYDLLRALRRDVIGEDFVFQRAPILRFHFPAPFVGKLKTASGLGLQQHSDTLGGHPFEMLQGWLPLCDCADSAALHVAPLSDSVAILSRFWELIDRDEATYRRGLDRFYQLRDVDASLQHAIVESCQPQAMSLGEVLLFDPRCIHGGVENRSDRTRVSLDFRLMPITTYEQLRQGPHADRHPRFVRGEIFHAQTIDEL